MSTRRYFVDEEKNVYLVVMDRGGLFGAYLQRERAEESAKAIEAVVAAVPVLADYRPHLTSRERSE